MGKRKIGKLENDETRMKGKMEEDKGGGKRSDKRQHGKAGNRENESPAISIILLR